MTKKYVSLEHAIRNAVRDQQYKKPLNEEAPDNEKFDPETGNTTKRKTSVSQITIDKHGSEKKRGAPEEEGDETHHYRNTTTTSSGNSGDSTKSHSTKMYQKVVKPDKGDGAGGDYEVGSDSTLNSERNTRKITKPQKGDEYDGETPVAESGPKKKKIYEDFEFEMARNELRTAIDAAKRLMAQLDGEGELEAWVQSKITKGADYLDTVADYMDSRDTRKLKEETEEIMEAVREITEASKQEKDDDETEAKKAIDAKYPTLNKIGDWVGNTITNIEKNIPSASDMRKKTANILGTEAPTPEDEKELNKREGAVKGAAFVGSAFLPGVGGGLIGKGLSGATGLAKSGASKILKSKPSSVVPKKVETPKVDIPDQVGKSSNVNSVSDYITKTNPGAKPANNSTAPKATEMPKAPEMPKAEQVKGGKKDAANQNTEAEQLGTGTTGLAPKPQKSGSPEKIEPYKTGVEVTKKDPVPEVPKANDNPKKANDNIPGKNANPSPAKAPAKAPEPGKTSESKPNPATERALKPAGFPEPAPYSNPKPNAAPSPAQAKSSPEPASSPAQAKSSPEPAPNAKPNTKPNTKKKVVPPPFKLPGGGKYKEPPSHTEYHNVPVQTSVSQARAHRIFKEEKLAGIVKSVVKKKREEKEGGPNPMVDFEPKLNHKYDNET